MRKWLAVSMLVFMLAVSHAAVVQADDDDEIPTLNVNGQGQVEVEPDMAMLRLGATVQAGKASEAQSQVNEIMQRAIEQIKAAGVPERHIQTSSLNLHPVYEQEPPTPIRPGERREPRIVGYRASNVLTVRIENLTRVGDVIDAGIAAGANELQGLTFQLKDDSAQRQQALREAVANARAKAEAMAQAMGVSLGGVQSANEGGINILRPKMDFYGGARMMAAEAAPTPVQSGQVTVEASVSISYRIVSAPTGAPPASAPPQ